MKLRFYTPPAGGKGPFAAKGLTDEQLAEALGWEIGVKGESFEFCHILDGVIELTEEGQSPVTYRKGDSFIMKPGYRGAWKTIETVRKIYVMVG